MQHTHVTVTVAAAATTDAAAAVLLSSPGHPLMTCFCPAPHHICCACSLCSKQGRATQARQVSVNGSIVAAAEVTL
jgi:hypothetical protein